MEGNYMDAYELAAALRLIDNVISHFYRFPITLGATQRRVQNACLDDLDICRHLILAELRETQ